MKRKRIGVLTAGGDTPALNATIYGLVEEANRCETEVVGLLRGYASLVGNKVPTVVMNPLFSTIPELDPCWGGTILGSSRVYVAPESAAMDKVRDNLKRLELYGLICIGGDGTINGMQPLIDAVPCVLAPKTIDNDLGLNYATEANDWTTAAAGQRSILQSSQDAIDPGEMINYVTPGFATAVFVVVQSIERIRTTAESHRRVAVVEVMGRQSGYIALGSAYAQPDIILVPEVPLNLDELEQQVRRLYEVQQHVVIVTSEGVRLPDGSELGPQKRPTIRLATFATAKRRMLWMICCRNEFRMACSHAFAQGNLPGRHSSLEKSVILSEVVDQFSSIDSMALNLGARPSN